MVQFSNVRVIFRSGGNITWLAGAGFSDSIRTLINSDWLVRFRHAISTFAETSPGLKAR